MGRRSTSAINILTEATHDFRDFPAAIKYRHDFQDDQPMD